MADLKCDGTPRLAMQLIMPRSIVVAYAAHPHFCGMCMLSMMYVYPCHMVHIYIYICIDVGSHVVWCVRSYVVDDGHREAKVIPEVGGHITPKWLRSMQQGVIERTVCPCCRGNPCRGLRSKCVSRW